MFSLGTVELLIQKNFLNGRKRNGWRIMTWGNGEKVIQKMNQVRNSIVWFARSSRALLTLQPKVKHTAK